MENNDSYRLFGAEGNNLENECAEIPVESSISSPPVDFDDEHSETLDERNHNMPRDYYIPTPIVPSHTHMGRVVEVTDVSFVVTESSKCLIALLVF